MSAAVILCEAGALLAGAVGMVSVFRSDRSRARWLFFAGMMALAAQTALGGMSLSKLSIAQAAFWQRLAMVASSLLPGCWVLFSVTYSREQATRARDWKWIVPLAVVSALLLVAMALEEPLTAGMLLGRSVYFHLGRFGLLFHLSLLLASVLVLLNLERTFRASVGTIRWRIKFVIIGVVILFGVQIFNSSQALAYRAINGSMEKSLEATALLIASVLFAVSLARSAFQRIDVHPSREMLRNSLTLLLTGAYLLGVGFLAKVLTSLGTPTDFPFHALLILVALVVLGIVLLSERIRQQTRQWIDRHFRRPVYDYRKVLMSFASQTSSGTTEPDLCRAVAKLIAETFQILSATIWLVEDNRQLVLAASTSLAEGQETWPEQEGARVPELLAAMSAHPYPLDLDRCHAGWGLTLQLVNPAFFRTGGHRLCTPLVAQNEVVGLINLGDRVGGLPFSVEEMDLLKCLCDQVAGSVLNLRLSRQLLRAKEMEAFQTMSAFFVHDLKNTVNALSLLLQNFSIHFQEPAFRADAQRAVANSVHHLTELVGRLNLLRQKVELKFRESDLNGLIQSSLVTLPFPKDSLVVDLAPVPPVWMDPDQILTVIMNLILNAREAGDGRGIEIATFVRPGWAVVGVRDRGCGMTPDFIRHSLFRPFHTTKKGGMGIGLYQSKIIVEAHRGQIKVESEPGKGTVFQVLLPTQGHESETESIGGRGR